MADRESIAKIFTLVAQADITLLPGLILLMLPFVAFRSAVVLPALPTLPCTLALHPVVAIGSDLALRRRWINQT